MKKLSVIFLCALSLTISAQTAKLSPVSRIFISTEKQQTAKSVSRYFPIKTVANETYVSAFIHLTEDADTTALTSLGVLLDAKFGTVRTARIPVSKVEQVSELEDVVYVETGVPVRPKMNLVRSYSNVDPIHLGTDLPQAFDGSGVIVGVVDYGFQYNHINFFNADKSALRVKRVWNQNKTGNPPEGFSMGYEYTSSADIIAAKYDGKQYDDSGHGTHVAGIAAGAHSTYYGIAREADIALVSYDLQDMSTDNVSILNGVKYIFDYATSVGKPAVVNLSLGIHTGPHDGTSTFDRLADAMQGDGRLLVGAAGNEGDWKIHYSQQFGTTSESKTCIDLSDVSDYSDYKYESWIDFWGEPNQAYTVKVAIINKSTGAILSQSSSVSALSYEDITFLPTSGASGEIYISSEKNAYNQKGNVSIAMFLNSLNSNSAVTLIIQSSQQGRIQGWTDGQSSAFTNAGLTGYVDGELGFSVGEIGGTGNNIISVGAYHSRSGSGGTQGAIAYFSSIGPTADGRLKPDITAPGYRTMSSVPDYIASDHTETYAGQTYRYAYMYGTSMSAPAVTGILALWLQANPALNPSRIRQIFSETQSADAQTGALPNNTWGYGKINAQAGILKAIQILSTEHLKALPSAIIAYPNPTEGAFKLLFTRNDTDLHVAIYAVNGQKIFDRYLGTVSERQEVDIDTDNIAAGAYIVKVNGSNAIHETFRLLVKR
ncbi:MAG: S8 family peptidase [Prevotellaceae bacterium]|jgi:subtilisin family serine protease|nr:S8 family peptidase [Prevotellaceae bacterium]